MAQRNFKVGSAAYKTLQAGIKALGAAHDDGAIHVVAVNDKSHRQLGWGSSPKGKVPNLTINLAQLDELSGTMKQNEANFVATGRHELQHVMDDIVSGDKPHDARNEFWHEVRGVRSETSVWEGMSQDDPWETWTSRGGLNMGKVYNEAQSSTNAYCPSGQCP